HPGARLRDALPGLAAAEAVDGARAALLSAGPSPAGDDARCRRFRSDEGRRPSFLDGGPPDADHRIARQPRVSLSITADAAGQAGRAAAVLRGTALERDRLLLRRVLPAGP